MSNKLLVCFWGKLKFGDYCRNNSFMLPEAYENDIHGPVVDYHFPLNLKTLMDNYKKQFPEFEIDFLLSTWDNVDTTQYESELKYLLKYPEPTDWESFLDEKGFPHTGSIRHHPEYHVLRPGPYTRLFHILNISNFSLAFILFVRDIIRTLTAFTIILGILIELASSLILFIMHIAELVNTSGIAKQNFIKLQCVDALEHNNVIASHLSNSFSDLFIIIYSLSNNIIFFYLNYYIR
jgi:hypothetical protein